MILSFAINRGPSWTCISQQRWQFVCLVHLQFWLHHLKFWRNMYIEMLLPQTPPMSCQAGCKLNRETTALRLKKIQISDRLPWCFPSHARRTLAFQSNLKVFQSSQTLKSKLILASILISVRICALSAICINLLQKLISMLSSSAPPSATQASPRFSKGIYIYIYTDSESHWTINDQPNNILKQTGDSTST